MLERTIRKTEMAVIGAMFITQDLADKAKVLKILEPEDFRHTYTIAIFNAMKIVYEMGEGIDPITVLNVLGDSDMDGEEIERFMSMCITECPSSEHILSYAKNVKHNSKLEVEDGTDIH